MSDPLPPDHGSAKAGDVLPPSLAASLALWRENATAWYDEWRREHAFKVGLIEAKEAADAEITRLRLALAEALGPHDGGWICEAHPELAWPHDACAGAGMPVADRVSGLVYQRDQARRALAEMTQERDHLLQLRQGVQAIAQEMHKSAFSKHWAYRLRALLSPEAPS